MSPACESVMDDLSAIVDGDADAIAKHGDHLAGCDDCRDARHDATRLARMIAGAGGDHVAPANLEERVLAKAVDVPVAAAAKAKPEPKPVAALKPRRQVPWLAIGAATALAAGSTGIYLHSRGSDEPAPLATAPHTGENTVGKLAKIERAAADKTGGVEVRDGGGWHPIAAGATIATGAELRTDDRTRATIDLADGTHLVLDHKTQLGLAPRALTLTAGRIVEDVVHIDGQPAKVTTPNGVIDIVGTKLAVTATDAITSVQVVRGHVVLNDNAGHHDDVRAGEEGTIERGSLTVSAVPGIAREVEWSELGVASHKSQADEIGSGIGSLRAYKPGESRDRDWNLALASHDVKVRIVGPIARTEITESFRNDTDAQLEGVYQFPLPADAQIDGLSLDVKGEMLAGAFVDKERGAKIWQGVIAHATPHPLEQKPEIIWVPGRWRDPALLDWKRGGRFELKIFPIPAKGKRTIKIAYTQVVTPRGPWRQYIYPLPHSADGSTVADAMSVDVEVRGSQQVRAAGYDLVADPARADVNAMTLHQPGFVPRGDLVIDYRPADDAELRAWTYAGGAAAAPDDKLAAKKGVGIDPRVVAAQHTIANDLRPTAVIALRPKLPRWHDTKPRDYAIVVDASQSMVGERFTRASELAVAMIGEMDRRDRVTVLTCDSECTPMGDVRTPSATVANEVQTWLGKQTVAGASDVVASIRQAAGPAQSDRERWVLYIGDGFASTGFRRAGEVEKAIADTTAATGVHVATIGLGTDADSAVLAAAARGGGGTYLAYVPGQRTGSAAIAMLDATYGSALEGASVELPMGLMDVAPTILPTIRNGQEVLIAARVAGDIHGDVIVKGKVAGQPFEQHYALTLAVSSAAGNGFVPRLWASLAIDQLEQAGRGDDRARIVALSQGYGVMSRETSLLVLESQEMFDAFGIDRNQPTVKWTGEDNLDEVASVGALDVGTGKNKDVDRVATGGVMAGEKYADNTGPAATTVPMPATPRPVAKSPAKPDAPAHHTSAKKGMRISADDMNDPMVGAGRARNMVPMRRVWTRVPSVTPYDGVAPSIAAAVTTFDEQLRAAPDSREKHRALVQALSYAGEIDRARDVAARWLDRDRLDPQALGYQADLLGRDGQRELGLRTLAGLVDLDPDRVALHERLVHAYESVGRMAQACGHRIAISALSPKDAAPAAGAVRCLRSLGRDRDALLVLGEMPDAQRSAIEKSATVAAIPPRTDGELQINAHWSGNADLDLSLVTPDGTRVSWMGGKSDAIVTDATSTEREQLAIRSIRRGNYLIEIARGTPSTGTVRGSVDVKVLGMTRSLPFELADKRVVVGRLTIGLESHLEEAWDYIDQRPGIR